jgi:hypothetical protein
MGVGEIKIKGILHLVNHENPAETLYSKAF